MFNSCIYNCLFKEFNANFYFYDIGFDAHYQDPLSSIMLEDDFYEWMACEMIRLSDSMVLTLEGGYNLEALARCNLKMINILKQKNLTIEENKPPEKLQVKDSTKKLLEKVKDNLSPFFAL